MCLAQEHSTMVVATGVPGSKPMTLTTRPRWTPRDIVTEAVNERLNNGIDSNQIA